MKKTQAFSGSNALKLLLGILALFPALCLAQDLELAITDPYGGRSGNTITIRKEPVTFQITLTNRSDSSKSVYWEADAGPVTSFSFVLTDENGRIFTVKRRKFHVASSLVVNSYLDSGKKVSRALVMNPDDWDDLPSIEPGKIKKYKARARFHNSGSTIESDEYIFIFNGS